MSAAVAAACWGSFVIPMVAQLHDLTVQIFDVIKIVREGLAQPG